MPTELGDNASAVDLPSWDERPELDFQTHCARTLAAFGRGPVKRPNSSRSSGGDDHAAPGGLDHFDRVGRGSLVWGALASRQPIAGAKPHRAAFLRLSGALIERFSMSGGLIGRGC
jgi:hypothetical protein